MVLFNGKKFNLIVVIKINYNNVTMKQGSKNVHNFFNTFCKQKGKFLPCTVVRQFFDIMAFV
jgi:hypothetical protein